MNSWRQRWFALAPALLLACCAVGWPVLSLVLADAAPSLRAQPPINAPEGQFLGTWSLLASSLAWIASIATLATIAGWPVGVVLASAIARGRGRWLAFCTVLPLGLPAYLVFWSLWQGIGAAALASGGWGEVTHAARYAVVFRETTLVLGLAAWAMPLVAWCVAAWRLARPDRSAALRRVDGVGLSARCWGALRHDGRAVLQGFAVASLGLLAESVSFDLAQVRTYAFELRVLDATGSPPAAVLAAGWPAFVVAAGLLLVASSGAGSHSHGSSAHWGRGLPASRALRTVATAVVLLCMMPIAILFLHAKPWHELQVFVALYARPAMSSLTLSLVTGVTLAVVAASLTTAWISDRRSLRLAARIFAIAYLLAAAVPATLMALAQESAWNRPFVGPLVYDTPLVLISALVARLGAVAVVASVLASNVESKATRRLRSLDAPRSAIAWLRLARPPIVAAALIAFAGGTALAFSEIAVTCRLVPPRTQLLATSTLNAIHYQQPETVLLASIGAILLGSVGAFFAVRLLLRRPMAVAAIVLCCATLGCEPDTKSDIPQIPAEITVGTPGFGLGQFRIPRAVAYDRRSQRLFVVDKQGRVQRFNMQGKADL